MYINRINKLTESGLADCFFISSPENLYYFSGFTGGEGALFLDEKRRILFTDSRYTVQAKNEAKDFEIIDIADKTFSSFLRNETVSSVGFEEDFVTFKSYLSLTGISDKVKWMPVSDKIYEIRMIKDELELSYIKKAAEIADSAFSYVLPFIEAGRTEKEIALKLEFFMRENGASATSFETISASGIRSALPHGVATDKKIENGDFLTLDFGCKYKGYSSDMTRTVVIGKASDKQKLIYETVLFAQKSALLEITSGALANVIDSVARNIIKDAGFGKYFGHGLGHSLGLNVHEAPSLSPKNDTILLPNMLMTVEPGIYIEDFGGVRIEDLVIIRENGHENLTHSPKELLEL